jgi:hypothetical protein
MIEKICFLDSKFSFYLKAVEKTKEIILPLFKSADLKIYVKSLFNLAIEIPIVLIDMPNENKIIINLLT